MFRSALGIVVSLFFWFGVAPAIHAESVTPSKSAKKPAAQAKTVKKPAAKKRTTTRKQVAKKQASKKFAAKKAPAPRTNVVAKSSSRKAASTTTADSVKFATSSKQGPVSRVSSSSARAVSAAADLSGFNRGLDPLRLKSHAALVVNQVNSEVLFEKNSDVAAPIASLTKLMTALVVVEANQDLSEVLDVTSDDIDREKHTGSRLRVGSQLTRDDMLHIALMSSENRAASALGRNFPGGRAKFIAVMNAKARALGMHDTHFVEPTGLSSDNVSSARDLAKLVVAAHKHALIRKYSTHARHSVNAGRYRLQYVNSNRLVVNPHWEIGLQKTGYITEAGQCLVMQARIDGRPVVMVFLDSKGKYSRLGDASKIRKWLEIFRSNDVVQASARES
jgi:D-alanyl-D-alanine endopeptidase (penicillin-binding protein 7)